jgi:hypothetical protein
MSWERVTTPVADQPASSSACNAEARRRAGGRPACARAPARRSRRRTQAPASSGMRHRGCRRCPRRSAGRRGSGAIPGPGPWSAGHFGVDGGTQRPAPRYPIQPLAVEGGLSAPRRASPRRSSRRRSVPPAVTPARSAGVNSEVALLRVRAGLGPRPGSHPSPSRARCRRACRSRRRSWSFSPKGWWVTLRRRGACPSAVPRRQPNSGATFSATNSIDRRMKGAADRSNGPAPRGRWRARAAVRPSARPRHPPAVPRCTSRAAISASIASPTRWRGQADEPRG